MTRHWQRHTHLAVEPLEPRALLSVGASGLFGAATGRSIGSVADDFANNFPQAAEMSVTGTSARQSGRIERAGDVDMFRIVAPQTGQLVIQQTATSNSRLDSYLYVYGANGQLLASNDDVGTSLNSRVKIPVTAGNTYYIKAAGYRRSVGSYALRVESTGNATTTNPPSSPIAPAPARPANTPSTETTPTSNTPADGAFQIDVTMLGFTTAQQQIVQQAVARWGQIIVGDLPDVSSQGRVIDDLAITITSTVIDGTGGILGQASATAYRNDSSLPYLGFVQLDTADVARMQNDGSLLAVLEHEIAHVLGFGVLWNNLGLVTGARTSSPGFTGTRAVAEYNALNGTNVSAVPVEASGGSGTALAHWRESILGNELMTGWYNSGQSNPLSRLTVASLADLGYQVNMSAADAFSVRNQRTS